jgi:hypothetical protein
MFLSLYDEVTNVLCVSLLSHDRYQYDSLILSKQTWAYPCQHLQQLLWCQGRWRGADVTKECLEKIFIFPLRYYANCVYTTLMVLILHNVESACFFYSNPVYLSFVGNRLIWKQVLSLCIKFACLQLRLITFHWTWLLGGVLSPFKGQRYGSVLRERFEVKIQILELTKGLDHAHSQHRNFITVPPVRAGRFTFILRNIARASLLWILYAYPCVFSFEVLCTGEGLWWTPGAQYTATCVLVHVTLFAGVQCTKCSHLHVKSESFRTRGVFGVLWKQRSKS